MTMATKLRVRVQILLVAGTLLTNSIFQRVSSEAEDDCIKTLPTLKYCRRPFIATQPNSIKGQESKRNDTTTLAVKMPPRCNETTCDVPPVKGQWVEIANKTHHAPVCCGWDNAHYKADPEHCGTTSTKTNWTEHSGQTKFYQQVGGHACTCRNFRDQYKWVSEDYLPEFDASATCQLLGNRTVLMIGDSTMQQAASTLMNMVFAAGCQTQMMFAAADTLIGEPMGGLNRGQHCRSQCGCACLWIWQPHKNYRFCDCWCSTIESVSSQFICNLEIATTCRMHQVGLFP